MAKKRRALSRHLACDEYFLQSKAVGWLPPTTHAPRVWTGA